MMGTDDFMDSFNVFAQAAQRTGVEATSYYYDDEDEDEEEVSVDLRADGHTLTFVINNLQYTSYCNTIDEFKQELHEQIDELVDECIFEALQSIDEDEDAEG